MFKLFFLILFPFFANASVECIGPTNASKYIIYLHGIDREEFSPQEIKNREILKKLANNLSLKIALPRAKTKCPQDKDLLCWVWEAQYKKDLEPTFTSIKEASTECFPNKDYNVVGFSNGGAAVSAFLRLCENPGFKTAISIGAGGGWFSSDPKKLLNCMPNLIIMLGSNDGANQAPVRNYINHLQTLKAQVKLIEYQGKHEILYEPLKEQLEKLYSK
ncbi:MAG: hypothetical protein H7177_13095 [Rhizobacter sp.]|nr:hypothetical protein [Bacteriovorax sp.]